MRQNGLLALLVASLMLNAFLMGRMTAPVSSAPANNGPAPTNPAPPLATQPSSGLETPHSQPLTSQPPPPAPAAPPAPTTPPTERSRRIEAYLNQVQALTAATMDLGDPSQFASELLQQSLLGDTSQLDGLLAQVSENRKQLHEISSPEECKEHKRLLLEQLASSQKMLEKLKDALIHSDSASLAGLAVEGRTLQQQVQRLSQLENQLRQLR